MAGAQSAGGSLRNRVCAAGHAHVGAQIVKGLRRGGRMVRAASAVQGRQPLRGARGVPCKVGLQVVTLKLGPAPGIDGRVGLDSVLVAHRAQQQRHVHHARRKRLEQRRLHGDAIHVHQGRARHARRVGARADGVCIPCCRAGVEELRQEGGVTW